MLKNPRQEFNFLDLDEAQRLVDAADGEWRTIFLVAMRTGMRQGELIGLRWEDVEAGRVRQNVGLLPTARKLADEAHGPT